jgi:hypothetical protein
VPLAVGNSALHDAEAWQNLAVAQTVSLALKRPKLEAVFGPLTGADDIRLRQILVEADVDLIAIAAHFGRERAGWKGTGLELEWYPSGQLCLSSFVDAADSPGSVDFCVELRPAWFYGEQTGEPGWDIEASIQADCHHDRGHRGVDAIWTRVTPTVSSPIEAVRDLAEATRELRSLAVARPLSHWLGTSANPSDRR